MSPFPGQLTRLGLGGTQMIVWQDRPYYLRALFTLINRTYGLFGTNTQ